MPKAITVEEVDISTAASLLETSKIVSQVSIPGVMATTILRGDAEVVLIQGSGDAFFLLS